MPNRPFPSQRRKAPLALLGLLAVLAVTPVAHSQDAAAIRKNLAERMPGFPRIESIDRTPIAGLYEVRADGEIFYADEQGNYLVQGRITDTRLHIDLTEARLQKINQIDFAVLPLKDAVVWKKGNGKRKLAIFADPNCGYCKQFERELQEVTDVTVYTFIIPVLGGDSPEKSRAIWCQQDNATAWRQWMIEDKAAPRAMGACDATAIARNLALSRKLRVRGTPAIVFEDGRRSEGAMPSDALRQRLDQLAKG